MTHMIWLIEFKADKLKYLVTFLYDLGFTVKFIIK